MRKRNKSFEGLEYENKLQKQFSNADNSGMHEYLSFLYKKIENEIGKNQFCLEIGSGAGISSKFLSNPNIIRTDLLAWESQNIKGNIDVHSLPYEDNHFEGVFAIDAIHHFAYPIIGLQEMVRVLKPNSSLVIIEPWVSFLSFLPFKIFHDETTTIPRIRRSTCIKLKMNPPIGDQTISRNILKSNCYISLMNSSGCTFNLEYFSPISFFATGGLSNPFATGKKMINFLLFAEKFLPQAIMKATASRVIIVIKKQYSNVQI